MLYKTFHILESIIVSHLIILFEGCVGRAGQGILQLAAGRQQPSQEARTEVPNGAWRSDRQNGTTIGGEWIVSMYTILVIALGHLSTSIKKNNNGAWRSGGQNGANIGVH